MKERYRVFCRISYDRIVTEYFVEYTMKGLLQSGCRIIINGVIAEGFHFIFPYHFQIRTSNWT